MKFLVILEADNATILPTHLLNETNFLKNAFLLTKRFSPLYLKVNCIAEQAAHQLALRIC